MKLDELDKDTARMIHSELSELTKHTNLLGWDISLTTNDDQIIFERETSSLFKDQYGLPSENYSITALTLNVVDALDIPATQTEETIKFQQELNELSSRLKEWRRPILRAKYEHQSREYALQNNFWKVVQLTGSFKTPKELHFEMGRSEINFDAEDYPTLFRNQSALGLGLRAQFSTSLFEVDEIDGSFENLTVRSVREE